MRGGSWINDARRLRAANRNRNNPRNRNRNIGFRVVFRPPEPAFVPSNTSRQRTGDLRVAPPSPASSRRRTLGRAPSGCVKRIRAFAELTSLDNVWAAWRSFERGKRRRPDVAAFGIDAERHVLRLASELREDRWRPGAYRLLRVRDPKRRVVAAAPIRDRVVHHAIHRVLAPRWNRGFIEQSYACLEGRGTHRALLTFARRARKHRWVLCLDISRYFYSIDRERLRRLLWDRLPEPPLRALLQRVLHSGGGLYREPKIVEWLGWDAPGAPGRGLPIGNLTSQWWGNVYLDGLDHHVCRDLRPGGYQRYMDDITLFGDDRVTLLTQREQIARWLHTERGLTLKDPNAVPRSTHAPNLYLGHVVTREGFRLGPKARGRLPARLRRLAGDPERAAAVVRSYAAAWRFGDGRGR